MKIVKGSVNNLQPTLAPIRLGCYTLSEKGLEVHGRPTYEQHVDVDAFVERCHKVAGWWKADLIAYEETRQDWTAQLGQAEGDGADPEGTRRQYLHIRKKFPIEKRVDGVPFGHHAVVARLELDDTTRRELLEQAALEGWSQGELRKRARATQRTKVIEGQAALEGMFRIIYADPPWAYNDAGIPDSGALGKASRHYPPMPLVDICALPIAAHALPDSVLFLWSTSPMLPDALEAMKAWDFTYKTSVVWDKVLGNWGHYVRVHHEILLIGTRGSCLPDEPTPMPDSVQTIRRGDEHSEKPEEFRRIITKLYTRGPYLELFARRKVEGWSCFGNDARLWADEMAEASA